MTIRSSLRQQLLIGASLGSLVLAGAAHAQSAPLFGQRGGANAADAAARAAQAQATQQAQTSSATQRAIQSFQRAAAVRNAMDQAQRAARAAAQAAQSNVRNGLGDGGLQVASGVVFGPDGKPVNGALWQGANGPTQAVGSDGRTAVTIDQTQQKAILTWDSFNVGRETDLAFNQQGSDWVALNRVTDAAAAPSQILGSIKAPGTVLVLNRNGVIFGGASQVNVRNLVAAAADITDTQFLNNGIYSSISGSTYTPSFANAGGAVTVEAGAQITTNAPETATDGGGYVLLMGTSVTNAGSITTARGQTLLSAGDDFIIRRGYGTEQNQYSTTRGNEVRSLIGTGSTSGIVTNSGRIEAAQGDITLAGRTIRQDGVLFATTGVNQRGTIHLLNPASDTRGSVTLGAGSLTMIAPDLASNETALDSQRDALISQSNAANLARLNLSLGQFDNLSTLSDRLDQSRVEIVSGGNVLFAGGSQTSAQGGQVAVQANAGRITVADGARIDVSGVMGVALDMASNSIKVNVQGNELRDSPQNRDNAALKNNDVWVDIRDLIYVPSGTGGYDGDRWYTKGGLLEVGGYLGNTQHTIGEWASVGGTITLAASEVIAQKGAIFDLSGGSLDYQAGYIQSTRVMGADGRLYDISQAPAYLALAGYGNVFSRAHDRWGAAYTQTYADALFSGRDYVRWENGYTVGRDAGTLVLSAPTVVMEADIAAGVIHGDRQTDARSKGVTDGYKLGQSTVAQAGAVKVETYLSTDTAILTKPVDTSLSISTMSPLSANGPLPAGIWFDANVLNAAGLGGLSVAVKGDITLDARLTLSDGGSLALYGGTVAVNGDVTARGGSIALGQTVSESLVRNTNVAVAGGVALDTRGLWTNLQTDPASDPSRLAFTDGGAVTIRSYGDVTLGAGSRIDASAGGNVLATGAFNGGNGGDISLIASYTVLDDTGSTKSGNHGNLTLDGTFASYGFGKGGKLTLETGGVVSIADSPVFSGTALTAGTPAPIGLVLDASFTVAAGNVLPLAGSGTKSNVANGEVIPAGAIVAVDSGNNSVTLASDWLLPTGASFFWFFSEYGQQYFPGNTIPAGTRLTGFGGTIPSGYLIPANTFEGGGLPINPLTTNYAAGTTAPTDVTYAPGTAIPKGTILPADVTVQRVSVLSPSLFQSGFSNYSINGQSGLDVANGAAINTVMPVLFADGGVLASRTGADISRIATLWTPPVYQEDPVNGVLSQRQGAGVSLLSGAGADASGYSAKAGWLTIGTDASITVDPGQVVRLGSSGQVIVDGTITAPGGSIAVTNNYSQGNYTDPKTMSVWIGDHAVLDVAARAYIATDSRGRRYGVVPDGGRIDIGSLDGALRVYDPAGSGGVVTLGMEASSQAYVVIRPGALLDASGTSGVLSLIDSDGSVRDVTVASNGGAIALRSYSGIHAEGSMFAFAGGTGASGGSLTVNLERPYQIGTTFDPVPAALQVRRVLTLTEAPSNSLAPSLEPIQADANLILGQGSIATSQVTAGGFDSLSLLGGDTMAFAGDISLSLGRSLDLKSKLFIDPAGGNVSLAAPYVQIAGYVPINGVTDQNYRPEAASATGTFSVGGDLIELGGEILPAFTTTNLASRGDLRFVSATGLYAPHNLTLSAARIYPASNTTAVIRAGYQTNIYGSYEVADTAAVLAFVRPDDAATLSVPYSAFGTLDIAAPTINQGGALFAPFGTIAMLATTSRQPNYQAETADAVLSLKAGSITSVSGKGLVMPYGGTTDNVTWTVDGAAPARISLATGQYLNADGTVNTSKSATGISLRGTSIVSEQGALVDLSGGGMLTGAGFVSGRGGSVDALLNPFKAGNDVYAIVPGTVVAPLPGGYSTPWTGDVPGLGQQITIPDGVPGLAAGTYTLLPANYALLPGAYRIELGQRTTALSSATALPGGSYAISGYQSLAHTAIRDALPTMLTITPGATVRSLSQYNETSYAAFETALAATFQTVRPRIEADATSLRMIFSALNTALPDLAWNGTAKFAADTGGYAGSLMVQVGGTPSGQQNLILAADGSNAQRSSSQTVISASAIDAIRVPNLLINALPGINVTNNWINFGDPSGNNAQSVRLESGAVLTGGQVLINGALRLDAGARIDTRSFAEAKLLDASLGQLFNIGFAVSNNDLLLNPGYSGGAISIGEGAGIYSRGTIALSGNASFDGAPLLGATTLALSASAINIGAPGDLAAAQGTGTLPAGLNLTQDLFAALVAGDQTHGIPGVRNLQLASAASINVFGSVHLDLSSLDSVTLTTPAFYGAGAQNDAAVLTANNLYWNVGQRVVSYDLAPNLGSALPGPITADGPGTGHGKFQIDARTISLGHPETLSGDSTVTFDHLLLGFSDVTLAASEKITTVGKTTLSSWQSGPSPASAFNPATYAGVGGSLTLLTPLLTTDAGGVAGFRTGGALAIGLPDGVLPARTDAVSSLGGRIDLNAGSGISLDTAIALPSGTLTATTTEGDILLGANSWLDLAGRATVLNDVTRYGWGGEVVLESTHGNILQSAGSVIDLSAGGNDAGGLTLTATDPSAGRVLMGGTLTATGGTGFKGGSIDVRAQMIGADPASLTADFVALNTALTTGGFTWSRSFDLKQGSLAIGDEVKARNISISIDGGNLIVNGRIDASGAAPGSISLAASGDLTLATGARLDAHGTMLQVDSYGQAIEAKNRGHVELTSSAGTLRLNSGAAIDLSTPDGASYGQVVLNAPRTGETSGDMAIDASGPLTLAGVNSLALNAFWTYTLPGGSTITQATLDGYDAASTAFINAAAGNSGLQSRLAGLKAYADAYHLRPGVAIVSPGDLIVSGDLDLSGYRYGPNADRDVLSPGYGAGEPMALVLRAGGNLTANGSISDGFGVTQPIDAAPGIYDNYVSSIESSSAFSNSGRYWDNRPTGTVVYLTRDWTIAPGDLLLPSAVARPQDTSGRRWANGETIPAGTRLVGMWIANASAAKFANYFALTEVRPGTPAMPGLPGTAAQAPMLAPGMQSASIRLVAGADLSAAATRTLAAASALAGSGNLRLANPTGGTKLSVVRTGTGSLDLLAGGSFSEGSLYGVYTAGTDTGAAGIATGSYMTDHGGDLTLVAQRDVTGYSYSDDQNNVQFWSPDNWLLRAVDADGRASWSIAFGRTVPAKGNTSYTGGFAGIGTLGGGNLTLVAGGNAGTMTRSYNGSVTAHTYGALQLAVASSGQVTSVIRDGSIVTGGTLVQTGGGDLTVKVRGVLNAGNDFLNTSHAANGSLSMITALRGDAAIAAGSVGAVSLIYGSREPGDPRQLDPFTAGVAGPWGGITLVPGDGVISVRANGDLVVGAYGDAGQLGQTQQSTFFSLWQPDSTAVSLTSAGGNLVPVTGDGLGSSVWRNQTGIARQMVPGRFSAVATGGNLFLGAIDAAAVELAPSIGGSLTLLADKAIYGNGLAVGPYTAPFGSLRIDISGANASVNDIPNPFRPVTGATISSYYNFFNFQDDTVGANPSGGINRVYAVKGDILNLALGENTTTFYNNAYHTLYIGNGATNVIAGGDIVNLGSGSTTTPGLILNTDANDVSLIKAGGNIYYTNLSVGGPGLLEVTAGGNIYQGDKGSITSLGALATGDTRPGAGIAMMAGMTGVSWDALRAAYLDPANLADLANGRPLDDPANKGKVAKVYDKELIAWLKSRYGYAAADTGTALTYFDALAPEQQRIFLRQVYYAELKAGGREYNDPTSARFGSYLRGREMIATLFPEKDAAGNAITRSGDIIMFGGSGVRTNFGGSIDMLAPGGQIVIGVQGAVPPASAGVVTQGAGDISLYSNGSILLGLSRILTTFGGSIMGWSATGDINAGRGAKTTVLYTPPLRTYDAYGNVKLSPQVPSQGAGIATLAPIAEVPSGDIDLIAPLGTIDAGEAGIRVSGNINLAALQVLNAANIQVKGNATGIPQAAVVNTGALAAASSVASAVTAEASRVAERARPQVRTEVPAIVNVRFVGFGDN